MLIRTPRTLLLLTMLLATAPAARAQFAVIDVASVAQLISEVQTLEQQLDTARDELAQAQAQYQSITGQRGMQQLLAGVARNYLPADWASLENVLQGPGSYPALYAQLQSALKNAAVLSMPQLSALAPAASAQLQASRQTVALLQGLSHQALANASGRFGELQQLISAIGNAGDQKAVLELQARIGAESGMLQGEQTKLQVLYQALQGQQWSDTQHQHELALAGHGQFSARFQPQP
ncbi:MAG TPA: type IV secretion system protein [Steroidobacteraceae bacterium]|jgi:type IV secretion system protein VirB5|nr:type IV secretion system protein [Steroidobacteraceae bacterium]